MMRRAEPAILPLLAVAGGSMAVARLRSFSSLSPPDLAFFHQATWNAARGLGFTQTALEFDAGTLLGSIHLSLIRVAWVPVSLLVPGPEALVALQGVGLTAGTAAAAGRLLPAGPGRAAAMVMVGLSPLALALGTCDLRPLTFLVPPAVLVVAAVHRARIGWLLLGVAGVLAAREEGWMVLAAVLPYAAICTRRHRRWPVLALLATGVATGLALPWLVWGHGGNITANAQPLETLRALLDGTRPWVRWPVEIWFAGRVLLAAWPAVRCPELLVPGLLGWVVLSVFSEMEPAAPDHGGLHYLSVVAPLVLAAAAVGLGRLLSQAPAGRKRWLLGLALGGVLLGAPEWTSAARWRTSAAHHDALRSALEPVRAADGPVLAVPAVAPWVSGRQVLRVQGHFAPTPERVRTVAAEVDFAVLPAEPPPHGPPADEWALWQDTLPGAGLSASAPLEGVVIWSRAAPSDR